MSNAIALSIPTAANTNNASVVERRYDRPIKSYTCPEALMWLSFIVPGMLSKNNLVLMNHIINDMPEAGAVVEIGTFAGLSLNCIIHMLKEARREHPVFSVDEWKFEGATQAFIPKTTIPFAQYRTNVIETFGRNIKLFHHDRLPHHILANSNAFFDAWTAEKVTVDFFGRPTKLGGAIAFAYVDGDHSYEQSRRDFDNVDRHLLPGGYILFDDSSDEVSFGSVQTAREVACLPNYELVSKATNYCLRKRW